MNKFACTYFVIQVPALIEYSRILMNLSCVLGNKNPFLFFTTFLLNLYCLGISKSVLFDNGSLPKFLKVKTEMDYLSFAVNFWSLWSYFLPRLTFSPSNGNIRVDFLVFETVFALTPNHFASTYVIYIVWREIWQDLICLINCQTYVLHKEKVST